MFISDIIGEAKSVLGRCSDDFVFKRITDAVRIANNQGKFDAALGQMDICVCDGCVTLPAEVATLLAVNKCGFPSMIRDQWFQYHMNGPGTQKYQDISYTDELGSFSTFKDPSGPVKLVAQVEDAKDGGKSLRVFGWDSDGKRIYSVGADGVLEDGFLVPMIFGFAVPNTSVPAVARIDRIKKDETNGFVKLIALDDTTNVPQTTIGYYLPWETNPTYRRIRVNDNNWTRIKYRKKDIEVRGVQDWINIDNREALLLLVRAVKLRLDNQFELARTAETEGMRLLSNEAEALRPPGLNTPQIVFADWDSWNNGTERLYY